MQVTALRLSHLGLLCALAGALALALGAAAGGSAALRAAADDDCTGAPQFSLQGFTVTETSIFLRLRIDTTGGPGSVTMDFQPAGDAAGATIDRDLTAQVTTLTISSGSGLAPRMGYTVGLDLRNGCDATQVVWFTTTLPRSDSPSIAVVREMEGGGSVSGNIGAPLVCGESCSGAAAPGTTVRLTAVPDSGYQVAGWDGICDVAGAESQCALSLTEDVTARIRFAPLPPPAPAVGGGSGGGGGGGGGGGVNPNLTLTIAAERPAVIQAGDTFVYVLRVKNLGPGGAQVVSLTVDLPDEVELLASTADRGPGCRGANRLDCFLDFLTPPQVATVRLTVKVKGGSSLRLGAVVTLLQPDDDLADNGVTTILRVGEPDPAAAAPGAKAPVAKTPTPPRMTPTPAKTTAASVKTAAATPKAKVAAVKAAAAKAAAATPKAKAAAVKAAAAKAAAATPKAKAAAAKAAAVKAAAAKAAAAKAAAVKAAAAKSAAARTTPRPAATTTNRR